MEKFNRTLRGYDPVEVNNFLDQVIEQVEQMVNEMKKKDDRIAELETINNASLRDKDKLEQYVNMEDTLHRAILMAEKTSDQIKNSAQQEKEIIVEDAKKNANRIVNEALMRAEKTEYEANLLRRNINIFKRRLKDIIEAQLDMVNDIEKVDF